VFFGAMRHVHLGFFLIYVRPILAGVILIVFMIKPIFSGFRLPHFSVPIGHGENPELFRLLGQLCQLLGAPIPSRVDVQLGVNASPGFRAGFSSLFGNDIMLRIGLPLVAGLNCREFAGVMAHELGHFRQRNAMRLGYLIGAINGWFGRAVYQRDELDAWIEDATDASGFTIFAFLLARISIGFTRGILWLFMICSHALNSFMSRQMEFNADACSLAVAGTEAFLALHQKLRVLDFSEARIFEQMKGKVQPKMPDDLNTYVALMASEHGGATQGKVLRAAASHKAKWYDSHPSDAKRNQRAIKANLPGLIQDTRPATCLFGDFSKLSRHLTNICYNSLRRPIRQSQLFHVEAPTNPIPDTTEAEASVKAFFYGFGPIINPLLFPKESRLSVGNMTGKIEQLRQIKSFLESASLLEKRETLKTIDSKLLESLQQQVLVEAGLLIPEADSLLEPKSVVEQCNDEWKKACQELAQYEEPVRNRLLIPLSLLRTPGMASTGEDPEKLQEEIAELAHLLEVLTPTFAPLLALRKQLAKNQVLMPYRNQNGSDLFNAVLQNETREATILIETLQQVLGSTAYPFKHVRLNISVADYARSRQYDPDTVRMTCNEAESHLRMLFALYFQALGRLVIIASNIERALEQKANEGHETIQTRPVVRIVKRTT
jgi:hypothetical protein